MLFQLRHLLTVLEKAEISSSSQQLAQTEGNDLFFKGLNKELSRLREINPTMKCQLTNS